MTATSFSPELLRFQCPSCGVELTVPATLAGIEGPCPSCSRTIQAPLPDALYEFNRDGVATELRKALVRSGYPVSLEARQSTTLEAGAFSPPDKNFKARLAIPAPEEPPDDSWKGRHRDQRRHSRRVRKAEKVAQSFLDSRGFQIARVALILFSGAMLAWLFQYLRTHQWRLPGMLAPVAGESQPTANGGARGDAVNAAFETAADDDTEIPPAANQTPAWHDPAQQFAPVASPGPR